ncbi:MAG: hypothetical protein JWR58_5304 [Pseudonocardia sp.]|nr:hypothetical protein [Pseudonocardia sp.]
MGKRDRAGQRRGPRDSLVIAGGTVALAGLLAFGLAPQGGQPSAATDPAAAAGSVRVLAPLVATATGQVVDGISSSDAEQLAVHIHAHLQVYVDGQQRAIPYGIGVVAPLQLRQTVDGPFVVGGARFYGLHTHDASGVIHIESPVERHYTIGEFFDLWGQPLDPEQVGPARGRVTALVDGTVVGGNPRDISLGAHDVIQLDVGAIVPFRTYTFAAGL